jgi:Flp pilus assembly protein CpaB
MKVRGIIALLISITMGFVGVKAVSYYLNKPAAKKTPAPVKKPKPDLFAEIPAGMRVVTVMVDDVSGISRKLKNGDRVDVIATTPLPNSENGKISRVILKDAIIYRDRAPETSAAKASKRLVKQKKSKTTVSLLLDIDRAAMLTAAANASDISVMIRQNKKTAGSQEPEKEHPRYSFTRGHGARKISGSTGTDYLKDIPKGMRAVTVPVTETDGICGIIRPGDHVDVLVSSNVARISGKDFSEGARVNVTRADQLSKIVLQNLTVLATENSIKGDCDAGMVSRATLLAGIKDALMLTAALDASKKMSVKLISRGAEDMELAKTNIIDINNIFFEEHYRPHKMVVYKGAKIQVMRF